MNAVATTYWYGNSGIPELPDVVEFVDEVDGVVRAQSTKENSATEP